jgi:NHL repeat
MAMKKFLLFIIALASGAMSLLAQPVITSQPTNQLVVSGGNATFSVMVTGVGPFTYQWQLNGANLPNRNNIITSVAGGGTGSAFSGDGGVATSAHLFSPSGMALNSAGDLFIADLANERIRMVETNYVSTAAGLIGIIHTVAGIGAGGYSGDGGMATNAGLTSPSSVAVDGFGNFYISDQGDNRIRKVDTNGIITTLAGTNSTGFSGDGGLAANAKLSSPTGVAVDGSGNLFIADWHNNRIRKISTNGFITTVAGTNAAGFTGDGGLAVNAKLSTSSTAEAVDGFGNLFIADSGNNRIRKVDTNGIITTFAGTNSAGFSGDGGAATNASLNHPQGVAADAYGDVFISDSSNNRIRMVDASGNITTVAGTGGTGYAGDGGPATNANIFNPTGLGVDFYGNVYVTGGASQTIRKIDFGRVPMLQLYSVTVTNARNYDVIVSSSSGSVTSSIVSLTVFSPPSITAQPTSVAAPNGSTVNFNVSITNSPPFSYQWFTSTGRAASAVPYVFSGQVLSAFVLDSGQGYLSAPQVHFVGGSGSGANGTAFFYFGGVLSINVINQGSGYTTAPPIIQIDPPPTINKPLPDQTNAMLTLPAVTGVNSTNYFVVVTNNYGSVTSSTVWLVVFLPPQNFFVQNVGTGLQMQFTGTPYYPYILQSATNLTPPINWQSIFTNSADVNGNWQFTDTNLNAGQKFYRAEGK